MHRPLLKLTPSTAHGQLGSYRFTVPFSIVIFPFSTAFCQPTSAKEGGISSTGRSLVALFGKTASRRRYERERKREGGGVQ